MRRTKKHNTWSVDEVGEPIPQQKSLGKLYKNNKKTSQRSPELVGQLQLQRHTLEAITRDLERADGDEVVCNIAAWPNVDKRGNRYITVELSPKFRPRQQHERQGDIMDFFSRDDEG